MTITLEAIRAAGGIVHSDGNIFFRDISMLQGLAGAAPAAVAGPAPAGWRLVPATPTRDWIAAVADGGYEDCDCAQMIASILSHAPAAPALEAPAAPADTDLRKALQFYANGEHFILSERDTSWDTVSGEPQNYWCDEAGTATVEDGTIAKMALAGQPIDFEEDDAAAKLEAGPEATDAAIDAIVLRQTGFDGDGYQAMTADELRRIVRSALGELAAAPQAPAQAVAHRLLRKNGAGEWVHDAGTWADGPAPAELIADASKHPNLYRIEHAYSTGAPQAPAAPILGDAERLAAARQDKSLADYWRNRVAGLAEEFTTAEAALYLADRIVADLYDLPQAGVARPAAPAAPAVDAGTLRDAEHYRFIKRHRLILSGGTDTFGWPIAPFGDECDRYIAKELAAERAAAAQVKEGGA